MKSALTLGPLLFHWEAEKRRDFYFRIADEAPVDVVYLGEVVCSKRVPFFESFREAAIERLRKGGKQVVLSSLALLTLPREVEALKDDAQKGLWIEANDLAAVQLLAGEGGAAKPFVVGPTINVLNEGTMDFLVGVGARRIVFASEMSGQAMAVLARRRPDVQKEVQVFGRQSLAVASRCYHARANGRDKDHCRMACAADSNGLAIGTLSGQAILAVSGTQTLSQGYVVLLGEMAEMRRNGVTHFRLSPHDTDMVAVARLYRDVLDGKRAPEVAREALQELLPETDFINGFYHGREGLACVPSVAGL